MSRCLKMAAVAAESNVPVLVLGETGTGKTLLAQAIHNSSRQVAGKFISFNASAMSDTLLESQLFGHERGAFTGAERSVKGKFELADGGTLFFDEVADMSLLAQAKVLRAVEYGEFERVGGEQILHSKARIISATNAALPERIRERKFRDDLYYRLAGLTVLVPPLRDRPEDLPGLVASELQAAARSANKKAVAIQREAMARLLAYPWPGNLRELAHTARTIILFCDGDEIQPEHVVFQPEAYPNLPLCDAQEFGAPESSALALIKPRPGGLAEDTSLAAAVNHHIRSVYDSTAGNRRQTARTLGISRAKLDRHLQKMALK